MSADFWAGYVSGAAGILIGNPLDIVKVNLQRPASEAASSSSSTASSQFTSFNALLKGTAAPVLGYGALNALMFMTYNRTMFFLDQDPARPTSLGKTWLAGALGGFATFVVSAPTELVKCRAQVAQGQSSSLTIARQIWREGGLRGLYFGGAVTSIRDSVGYGFYFWSYELSKKAFISSSSSNEKPEWMTVLLCGGIAGVVTWASIFPLDVIKTRVQTQGIFQPTLAAASSEQSQLLQTREQTRLGATQIAKQAYRDEGMAVFFRGLGVCSLRAFFVNAVQWAVYEWMMHILLRDDLKKDS